MYQTLYRKYRPDNFDEVYGQDVIIKTIKNAIKNDKINHAYLFSGPRGTGKTSTAKIIAKTINCLDLKELKPCNKCVNCTQINNKQSLDIIEIDAASNNGVDEIRELRNNVNLVPSTGKYKIYIIDEVHMLTIGAFNALLKTLEEPPSHVIFILATTEIYKIPNTILSRCQKFEFKKIGLNKIKNRLDYIIKQEKIDIEESAITEIARLSDGGMRDALSILDQVLAYSDSKITVEDVHEINGTISQKSLQVFIENLIDKKYNELFEKIDEYDNNGKNFVKISEEIINFYRNVLLSMNAEKYLKNNNTNYLIYSEVKEKISEDDIMNNINYFNEMLFDMKKSNNPKLIFETIIIKILNGNKKSEPIEIEKIVKEDKTKKTVKTKIKIKNSSEVNEEILDEIKKIRINNTLCKFNKKQLLQLKPKVEELRVMLMDPKYSEITSLLFEGILKAVGEDYLIFVYDDERLSRLFNENLITLEEMFKEKLDDNYKLISTSMKDWNRIKDEFNNKKIKYELMNEISLSNIKKTSENNIDDEFSDIIEYS